MSMKSNSGLLRYHFKIVWKEYFQLLLNTLTGSNTGESSQHDDSNLLEKKGKKTLLYKVLDEISITNVSHLKQKILADVFKIPTCF